MSFHVFRTLFIGIFIFFSFINTAYTAPDVDIIYPDGDLSFCIGDTMPIQWDSYDQHHYLLELTDGWDVVGTIDFYENYNTTESFNWKIPSYIYDKDGNKHTIEGSEYRIKIVVWSDNYHNAPHDHEYSDSFSIGRKPEVDLLSPNFGGDYEVGDTITIEWDSELQHHYSLELMDGSSAVGVINYEETNHYDENYEWTIPSIIYDKYKNKHTIGGSDYKIKVVVWSDNFHNAPEDYDISSDSMTIEPQSISPTINITKCPSGTLTSSSFTFEWDGDDSDGYINKYYYDLDDSTPDNSTNYESKTYDNIDNGWHEFYVKAEDNDGEYSTVKSCQFYVDIPDPNQKPAVSIENCPYLSLSNSSYTFQWDGDDSDGFVNKYYYRIDNQSFSSTTSTSKYITGLSNGSHTLYVKAEDNDGAESGVATCQFQVNKDTPDPADLSLSKSGLTVSSGSGSYNVYVQNQGDETLYWDIASSSGISLSPVNGSISGGNDQKVVVTIPQNNTNQSKSYQIKFYNTYDNGDYAYLTISQSEFNSCDLSITGVFPSSLTEGQSDFDLKIYGTDFGSNPTVYIPGVALSNIQRISSAEISAKVTAVYGSGSDGSVPEGDRPITVKNNDQCKVKQNGLLNVKNSDNPEPPPQPFGDEWIPYSDGFDYPVSEKDAEESSWRLGYSTQENNKYGTDFLDYNYYSDGSFHTGEDWNLDDRNDLKKPVYSVANGKIEDTGKLGKGRAILIKHKKAPEEFYWSQYAHLDPESVDLEEGDFVFRGQKIGEIGAHPKGAHLHFEMRDEYLHVGKWPSTESDDAMNEAEEAEDCSYNGGSVSDCLDETCCRNAVVRKFQQELGYMNPTNESTTDLLKEASLDHIGTFSNQPGFVDGNRPEPDNITNLMDIYEEDGIVVFGEYPDENEKISNVRNRYYIEKRSSFISILIKALEERANKNITTNGSVDFDDVDRFDDNDNEVSYYEALVGAGNLGIVTSGGKFRPGDAITKYEALKFTVETYEEYEGNIELPAQEDWICIGKEKEDYQYNSDIIQKGHAIGLTEGLLDPDSNSNGDMCFVADRWVPRGDTVQLVENLAQLLNPYINNSYLDLISDQGSINQGQIIQKDVNINDNIMSSIWKVTWGGSDIDLSIETPSGKTLTPSDSNVEEFYEGKTEDYYVINDPEKGTWKVDIIGVDIDPEGEPYQFTVQVIPKSDSEESQDGKIKLLAPNPSDPLYNNTVDGAYRSGQRMKIVWLDDDNDKDNDVESIDLYYSISDGNWQVIATDQPADAYYWSSPADFIHDNVRVKVVAHYNTGITAEAVSEPFRVIDGSKPSVTIIKPDGGEYYVGDPMTIEWQASSPEGFEIERVDISSYVNGVINETIARQSGSYINSGSYTWYPTDSDVTDRGQIGLRVWCTNDTFMDAMTQDYFTVKLRPIAGNPWSEVERPFDNPEPGIVDFHEPDVVMDSNDNIHVAAIYKYEPYEEQRHQVFYRKKTGNQWGVQEQITNYQGGKPGYTYELRDVEMAVDQQNIPHILFEYVPPVGNDYDVIPEIYYATKDGNGWHVENISESYGTESWHPKIVVDKNNNIHAFWYERDEKQIYYRAKMAGQNYWKQKQIVPGITRSSFDVSIDDNNVIHLAGRYSQNSERHFRYIHMKAGQWSPPELLSNPPYIERVTINSDGENIYAARGYKTLSLHTRTLDGWESKDYAFAEAKPGDDNYQLLCDASGNLHVIYPEDMGRREKMVERVFNGSSWSEAQLISSVFVYDDYSSDVNGDMGVVCWKSRYNDSTDIFLSVTEFPDSPPKVALEGEVSSDDPYRVDFTVQNQNSQPGLEYTFNFGNGDSRVTSNPGTTYTYSDAGTYNVTVVAKNNNGLTGTASTKVTVGPSFNPVLSVNPESLDVSREDDVAEIEIKNTGTGQMEWLAQVNNADWLSIISLDAGVNDGKIVIRYAENAGEARSGELVITAEGAGNSPVTVSVDQKAAPQAEETMAWKKMSAPPLEYGKSIWGSSADDIFAAGTTDDAAHILHYDGSTWTKMDMPETPDGSNTGLMRIMGSSANNVFAVGADGSIFHYDGMSWEYISTSPNYFFEDLWVDDSGIAHMVCSETGSVFRFDGDNLEKLYQDSDLFLRGIWGDNQGNLFVAGDVILKYNGAGWEMMASPTDKPISRIWGTRETDIYAVGADDTILHYNGVEWRIMNHPPANTTLDWLAFVWGTSSDNVFTNCLNTEAILQYDGNAWTEILGQDISLENINEIWGSSENNLFAVTSRGEILHYGNMDSDGDGLPDDWETENNLDPNRDDASEDPDGDGLTNLEEYQGDTDPHDANTQQHFTPIWKTDNPDANPWVPMNLYAVEAKINEESLSSGDEIGVFDGDICVGMAKVTGEITINQPLEIITSQRYETREGFTAGHRIQFRIWDASENEEISDADITATYFSVSDGSPIDPDPVFNAGSSYGIRLNITQTTTVKQMIPLIKGPNLISSYVMPENTDIQSVFEPLMNANTLEFVEDESGKRLNSVFGNWQNQGIPDFSYTEGYTAMVKENTELLIEGAPVALPVNIPLSQGPNIIGYPVSQPQPSQNVFQPLMDDNSLEKVQDEKGKRILKFIGKWRNGIGELKPGEGYKVKVYQDTHIEIGSAPAPSPSPRRARKRDGRDSTKHFSPIWSGNPANPMNLWIIGIDAMGIESGDEIGVFDGDKCVGAGVIASDLSSQALLRVTTSQDMGDGNGFTEGNAISIRFWDSGQDKEISDISPMFLNMKDGSSANPKFEKDGDYGVIIKLDYFVRDLFTVMADGPNVLDVLARDNMENTSLTLTEVSVPINGSATIKDKKILYTPDKDYRGMDIFNYTVTDGAITATATVRVKVGDGQDTDNDNISDSQEEAIGTDPDNPDTDGDGFSDGYERENGHDPLDPEDVPEPFTAGVFVVGDDGEVRADWLFDGGLYKGELGIFSLSGMEELAPDSEAFITEALNRVTSDSEQGHVIFRDADEGARFSGNLGARAEEDFNQGDYKGIKTLAMVPGDRAALALIPDGSFEAVQADPMTSDPKKRPLFSLSTANPDDGMYYGQIAGVCNQENEFLNAVVFEDIAADHSDRDYNDVVVKITGVSFNAPTLDGLIEAGFMPGDNDWRKGQNAVMPHLEVPAPGPDTRWLTITLKSPADLLVYDSQGRSIGKEGGHIPGATFEWDENGHQVITLPALNSAEYAIVLRAIGEGGLCHLEIRGYQGDAELNSLEKALTIGPNEVMKTLLDASAFVEDGKLRFDKPRPIVVAEGENLRIDYGEDNDIDAADIETATADMEIDEGDPEYEPRYDLDGSGCIGMEDLLRADSGRESQIQTLLGAGRKKAFVVNTEVAAGTGVISAADDGKEYELGEASTYTVVPAVHYEIADVRVNGESIGAVSSHELTFTQDSPSVTTIQAYFTEADGDVNSDGTIDLSDAILGLQLQAGITPQAEINPSAELDSDDNNRMGMEEVIYILGRVLKLEE